MDEESAEMFEQTEPISVPTFSPFHEAIYPIRKMAQKSLEFQRKLGIYQNGRRKVGKSSWTATSSWATAPISSLPTRIMKAAWNSAA